MGNNHSRIDRDILIPIGISVFSIIGICIVLMIAFRQNNRLAPAMTATTAPRQSQPRENRSSNPGLATPIQETNPAPEAQETVEVEETSIPALPPTERPQPSPTSATPTPPAVTQQNTSAPVDSIPAPPTTIGPTASRPTASGPGTATYTAEPLGNESELFLAGKYDDTDIRIVFEGEWTTELFMDEAYEETITISTSTDSTATFRFVGNQVELGYLSDLGFGTALLSIDGKAYPAINQGTGSSWLSPQLASGQHSVVIRHQAGDMICIDYIRVRG